MNQIKNLALRAAATVATWGALASNALAQYPLDVTPITGINTTEDLKTKITAVTNIFVGFVSVIAAIILLYGAYLYITAGANEDNAKKGKTAIIYAIIGILVAALVYVIANVAGGLISGA